MPTPPKVPEPREDEDPGPDEIARDEAQTERQAPPNADPGEPASS